MPHFIALWTKPETDVEGFEEHYRTTHVGLVQQWPGFVDAQVIKTPTSPMGDPEFHLITVIEVEDLGAALRSPEAKAAIDDAQALMGKHGNRLSVLTGDDLG